MSKQEQQLQWMERLAELAESGMPLPEGLRSAAAETPSRVMTQQLLQLADDLESGSSWDQVLLAPQHGLSPHLMAIVQAGLQSGNLGDALNGLVDHYRQQRDVWRQLIWALTYPITVLAFAVGLLIVALMTLVPAMTEVFTDFGTELPPLTVFWISVGRTFPTLALCGTTGIAIALMLVRMFGGRIGWHRFVASIPVIGPLFHWASVAEMVRLLQICTVQEMQLPKSLELTASAVGNPNMAKVARWLADGVDQGMPLARLLDATPRIPNFIVPIIRWGEKEGALEEAFESVHEILIGRIRMRSTLLSGILAPLIFIFVASTIGSLIIGMYLPLVRLIQNLT